MYMYMYGRREGLEATQMAHVHLTIRLQAQVFYEQIVNEVQPSWLSLIENEGE